MGARVGYGAYLVVVRDAPASGSASTQRRHSNSGVHPARPSTALMPKANHLLREEGERTLGCYPGAAGLLCADNSALHLERVRSPGPAALPFGG